MEIGCSLHAQHCTFGYVFGPHCGVTGSVLPLPQCLFQEIIGRLLATYAPQAVWMMIAVSKVRLLSLMPR